MTVLAAISDYLDRTSAAPCPRLPVTARAPVAPKDRTLDALVRQTQTRLRAALRKATPPHAFLPEPTVWSPVAKSARFRTRVKFRVPCMTQAQVEATKAVAKVLSMRTRVYAAGDGRMVEGILE